MSTPARQMSVLSDEDWDAGVAILLLVLDFPSWVHRRVESIEILDDTRVRRRVSLDVEPPELDFAPTAKVLPALPITFLRKEVMRDFDLDDPADEPVPVLTKSQNGQLAGDTLVVLAETLLDRAVPGSIEGPLRSLAEASLEAGAQEFALWHRFARDNARPDAHDWQQLMADRGFRDYAAHLSRDFILFAQTPVRAGERRLLKLGYEEDLEESGPRGRRVGQWRKLGEHAGWVAKEIRFAAPAVNLASSFHFELAAPPEMEVDKARLDIFRGERVEERFLDGQFVGRIHLYAPNVGPARRGAVRVLLRARRQGLISVALSVAVIMALLLGFGLFSLDSITEESTSQTAAALLLLGPTLLAAGLIRFGEHELVSSVLRGPRLFLWAEIVAGVIAVAVLAGMAEGERTAAWIVALVIGGLAAACLVVSYLLPRPTSSPEYEPLPPKEED